MISDEEKYAGGTQVPSPIVPVNLRSQPASYEQFGISSVQTFRGAYSTEPIDDASTLTAIGEADQDAINQLIAFVPTRMKEGMIANLYNPITNQVTRYRLVRDPESMVDESLNSLVTADNWGNYWILEDDKASDSTEVRMYANSINGGLPTFPYTPATENEWSFVQLPSNKYFRVRYNDNKLPNGIYSGWTPPIAIGAQFESGDFVENRYRRQDVDETAHTGTGTLTLDKSYVVESGDVDVSGDLTTVNFPVFGNATSVKVEPGRVFKFISGNTYTFNAATVKEIIETPPRTISGQPNNTPAGWNDTIPAGSSQLWEITAQKTVRGILKSNWTLRKIVEDPNLVRYSVSSIPDPNTLVGTTISAADGTQGDTDLINAGWVSTFNRQAYIATRDNLGGGTYSSWLIQKIEGESGEYLANVFKLAPVNLDIDTSPLLVAPTQDDAVAEGYSDVPLSETDTQVNYVSTCIKFFDGSNKTPWSRFVPNTGKPVYVDGITSDVDDNFKYTNDGSITPSDIVLTAKLFKGNSELWQNNVISYTWRKVYDNGAPVNVAPDGTTFQYLGADGTPGDSAYLREFQRLRVFPSGVNGKAVFRCTQVLDLGEGATLTFISEFSILDITDGKDARDLSITSNVRLVVYDTVNTAFNAPNFTLRAYQSNLTNTSYRWFRKPVSGGPWTIVQTGGTSYTETTASLFTADGSQEAYEYAVSNAGTDPASADYITTFTDYITITKIGASAGSDGGQGEDSFAAILDNESQTIAIDSVTGLPLTGEEAKAFTEVEVFKGASALTYTTGTPGAGQWRIESVADTETGISFDFTQAGSSGTKRVVRVTPASWTNGNITSVQCTITINAEGSVTITKKFSIATTRDAEGSLILDIDGASTGFTPQNRGVAKVLTANLWDSNVIDTSDNYYYKWTIVGGAILKNYTVPSSGGRTVNVTRDDVKVNSLIRCDVSIDGTDGNIIRSRTIEIVDFLDAQLVFLYNNNGIGAKPSLPPNTTGPAGDANWKVLGFYADPAWECYGDEYLDGSGNTRYNWYGPRQIKSEKGDQGNNGDFYFEVFTIAPAGLNSTQRDALVPNNANLNSRSAVVAALQGDLEKDDWYPSLPYTLESGDAVYSMRRRWNGEGYTGEIGDGYPNTAPVAGTLFSRPQQVSGPYIPSGGGPPGPPGVDGDPGPGYSDVTNTYESANRRTKLVFTGVNGAPNRTVYIPDGQPAPNGNFKTAGGTNHVLGPNNSAMINIGTSGQEIYPPLSATGGPNGYMVLVQVQCIISTGSSKSGRYIFYIEKLQDSIWQRVTAAEVQVANNVRLLNLIGFDNIVNAGGRQYRFRWAYVDGAIMFTSPRQFNAVVIQNIF
jgi:hypothetical protein